MYILKLGVGLCGIPLGGKGEVPESSGRAIGAAPLRGKAVEGEPAGLLGHWVGG